MTSWTESTQMLSKKEEAMSFEQFQKAMEREANKEFQTKIASKGLDVGKIDGYIGDKTRSQIPAYVKMEELKQDKPAASSKGITLFGKNAVKKVTDKEGDLDPVQAAVVELEGYVPSKVYLDQNGVPTYGVGQTGEYIGKSFKESYDAHVKRAKDDYENYTGFAWENVPDNVKQALVIQGYQLGSALYADPDSKKETNFTKQLRESALSDDYSEPANNLATWGYKDGNEVLARYKAAAELMAGNITADQVSATKDTYFKGLDDKSIPQNKKVAAPKVKDVVVPVDKETSFLEQFGSSLSNLFK